MGLPAKSSGPRMTPSTGMGIPRTPRLNRRASNGYHRAMDIDTMRERNEEKAEEEKSRGPVSGEPDSSPLGEAIADFHERGALPFGIPAHRSGTGAVTPDAADW